MRALEWNSGTSRDVVPQVGEREYVEAESRRRECRMRGTGADQGVVAMKGPNGLGAKALGLDGTVLVKLATARNRNGPEGVGSRMTCLPN